MGEVYKARDTRLDRTVAIKVLPAHFAESERLRQRFEREARALASLSHPHICTLYDVGHENGIHFLVMEYLEGETLAARLERGPIPTEQLLRAGSEIADALDKAHRQGVVHRDLKPGNIMLTKAGVKLLDFGLAKGTTNLVASALTQVSAVPTRSQPLTAEGTLVGTLHYMAPEQLEGQEADARSDIFALGAVLYEMATGRRAFLGKSQASIIAAILSSEPTPISALQPMTPPALDRAAKRCLAKDPDDRWQSARDLLLELKWVAVAGSAAELPATGRARHPSRERLAWVAAVLVLAASLGLALVRLQQPPSQSRPARFSALLPEKAASVLARVSPDGRYLSFTAIFGGQTQLWLRPLGSLEARPLAGTEGALFHFWSPDSRFIAFLAEGKLKKIDVTGGLPQTLCDAPGSGPFRLGAWGRDGTILFRIEEAPGQREGLYRVSAAGGEPQHMTVVDESGKELMAVWPSFLPDGRRFLFPCVRLMDLQRSEVRGGICAASLDSGQARKLLDIPSYAEYAAPGYLVYAQGPTLFAQPFDAGKLRVHGEPVRIAEGLEHWSGMGVPRFSVSSTGVLVYQRGGSRSQLLWKDRNGRVLGEVGPPGEYDDLRISPDGRKLVVTLMDPQVRATDLWIVELGRNVATRFTPQPVDAGGAVWSPDGSRMVYCRPQDAPPFLHTRPLSGGEEEVLLPTTGTMQCATDWSPDGRFLLYMDRNPSTNWDIWILPLEGERKPILFLRTRFREGEATFSPDGRWVAYASDESGRSEVYVQPFQRPGETRRISAAGGSLPRWRRDGRELFYIGPDGQLMAVPMRLGASLEPGTPAVLFTLAANPVVRTHYDVSHDGQRFLVVSPEPGAVSAPTVVLNWTADMPR